jgi:LmbE family N-acetylglucosaminyl deacetylase
MLLVVSTHFDDAALSLSHLLQQVGERATVVTVCAGVPASTRGVSDWDLRAGFASGREAARTRRREDELSCEVTGAGHVRLRHLDGPYRERTLRAPLVRRAVERLLRDGAALWLPAGIGEHPDHVAVRTALLPLASLLPPDRVGVYADLPYAGLHGFALPRAVAAVLPGLRGRSVHLRGKAFERKLDAVRCHASQLIPLSDGAAGLLDAGGVLARERIWTGSCARESLADPAAGVILQE